MLWRSRLLLFFSTFSVWMKIRSFSAQSLSARPTITSSSASKRPLPRMAPSFYQRPLPSTCTAFSSPVGRRMFESAMQTGGLKSFFALIEQHTTQTEPAYCGLATLVVSLNAMAIDPLHDWKKPWRWYHEELFDCCQDLEDVKKRGITMADFRCLAICQGLEAEVFYADVETTTLQTFREAIRQACVEDLLDATANTLSAPNMDVTQTLGEALSSVLVVSYDRKTMGQTGSGHFSPIAAYDSQSDSVLILDTARFKYNSHWVPVPLLFDALKPVDPDSGRSRGYIILKKNIQHLDTFLSQTPQSLLRPVTGLNSKEIQQRFLTFLRNSTEPCTWNELLNFWTQNGTDSGFVWYFCRPSVKPCQEEDTAAVEVALHRLRTLMHAKVERNIPTTNVSEVCVGNICQPNYRRSIPLLHAEAIFLLYLATRDDHELEIMKDSDEGSGWDLIHATIERLRHDIYK